MRFHVAWAVGLALGVCAFRPALAQDITAPRAPRIIGDGYFNQRSPDDAGSSYFSPVSQESILPGEEPAPSEPVPAPEATGAAHCCDQTGAGCSECGACQQCGNGQLGCGGSQFGCGCGACGDYCDEAWPAVCQNCPNRGAVLFAGIDSWRGVGDRGNRFDRASNNNGGSVGFNWGTRLGRFSDLTGIGFQVGGSYGVYDWDGRPFNAGTLTTVDAQQQTFLTMGFFHKANGCSRLNYGVVHDYMFNQAFGAYAVNPTLGQWRGQIGYAVSAWNEVGLWATCQGRGSSNTDELGNRVATRAISQTNFFWHHKCDCLADTWLWIGWPDDKWLGGGTVGNFLIGGSVIAPLNDRVALYANTQYMHPRASPGNDASGEASWYVGLGLQFTIGGSARTNTVAGNCWLPLMPLANNGNFLVDSHRFVTN